MNEIHNSTPLLDGHDYHPVKRCPKCFSVFITDDECEGCGYQLNYNPIGEAFGEKSFYSLKEAYWDERGRLVQLWPDLERKKSASAKKYVRDLSHRYDMLLEFLLGESDEDRGFYWLEFQDLCRELLSYSVELDTLSRKLNDHSFHGYAPLIHEYLKEQEVEYLNDLTLWDRFLGFKIGGVLQIRFLLISSMVLAAISTASLLVYQYFFLFS